MLFPAENEFHLQYSVLCDILNLNICCADHLQNSDLQYIVGYFLQNFTPKVFYIYFFFPSISACLGLFGDIAFILYKLAVDRKFRFFSFIFLADLLYHGTMNLQNGIDTRASIYWKNSLKGAGSPAASPIR